MLTYTDQGTGKKVMIDPLNITLPGFAPGQLSDVSMDMIVKTEGSSMGLKGRAQAKAIPSEGVFELSNVSSSITMSAAALRDDVKVSLSGQGRFNTKEQSLSLNVPELKLGWSGTEFTGKTKIDGKFSSPVASFSVNAQKVNMDTLLAGVKKDEKQDKNKPLLPVEMLQSLNMNGDVKIAELIFSDLSLKNVEAEISAKNGLVNIAPITADIYEGRANASVRIDATKTVPAFVLKNEVTGVEMGQVLLAKMGDDYITGKANVSYDITATGNTMPALQNSAGGLAKFNFGEGYINKWQVSRLLNQAIAFFESGALAKEQAEDKIYFTALKGSFKGQNGVFTNSDTVMTGPKIYALGAGLVNLPDQFVDYKIRAGMGSEPDPQGSHIPISMKGPFSKVDYGLDTSALLENKVKEKIQDKLMDKLGGEPGEDGTASPEAEAVNQLLDGFFGGQ
jgi:AsmA protein